MISLKDLIYAKQMQSWYRPKWKAKLWKKFVYKPILVIKLLKAEIETDCNIQFDREFNWLLVKGLEEGCISEVHNFLKNESKIRKAIISKRNKVA